VAEAAEVRAEAAEVAEAAEAAEAAEDVVAEDKRKRSRQVDLAEI
jgi:hypothetical protein